MDITTLNGYTLADETARSQASQLASDHATLASSTNRVLSELGMAPVASGHFSSTASGIITEFKDVEAGATYTISVWNPVGAGGNFQNAFAYVMHSDGTNTKLAYTATDAGFEYEATIATGDYIRLYMNKIATATTCECDWSIHKNGENKLVELEKKTEMGCVSKGRFYATASGVVTENTILTAGKSYRVVVWDAQGGGGNFENAFVYQRNVDAGTSTAIAPQTYSNGYVYDVTIAEGDSLRLYMNKASSAVSCSCEWAIFEVNGNRVDAIEEDLKAMKKTANSGNNTTCKIFRKVVCCGDSYTSGYIVDASGTVHETNEDYAWPHYMATATGNEWVNCGKAGANVLTWQTNERGLAKAQAEGKAQAYVVGLMLNDVASGTERYVELGTSADIGTNAQTYYGGLSQIVKALATISPKAKIFVCTCPKTGGLYTTYNQAVRDVVNYYKSTYAIHCLDLNTNISMYNNASLTNDLKSGHYTAAGYERFAEILCQIMSQYINDNVTAFQDVAFIEYDA